jgi:hypothetical protein
MPTPTKPVPGAQPVWPRRAVGWLVACMLVAGAAFVALRLMTPSDGTRLPSQTWAWTGAGVVVEAHPDGGLRDHDLVTAIGGIALGGARDGWGAPSLRVGDRLTYQVVRDGRAQQVSVVLRRADVARPLLQAWGTIMFVAVLFGVVAYLYGRRAGPATSALLVLSSGLLASTLAVEIGVSAVDARGGLLLWLYLFDSLVVYVAGWAGLVTFSLLFPSPSRALARHRWLLLVAAATPLALLVAWALLATLGAGLTHWVGRVIAGESWIVMAVLTATIVLGVARYLTVSDPVARQQLKWLAGGGCLSATLALALWFGPQLFFGRDLLPPGWLGFSGLPLVAGLTVAVLRYRLFDLDRVVSRTVAYALLTVLLGGGYTAVVLGVGRLVSWGSTPVVAAATLAVAAVFQPARRRIQDLVDRRFNRRRYDAGKTIEAFSVRSRQETDLETLSAELLAVVDHTMQPTWAALWLRHTVAGNAAISPFTQRT